MSGQNYNRDKVSVGKIYKIYKLRTGVSTNGTPYWAFSFGFYENNGVNKNIYKWITLMSREKCWVKEGEIIELKSIDEYIVKRAYNKYGGIIIYETLVCKFEKANYETK